MKLVVIGGVAAGMSAAAKARRVNKDAEIVVYEKGNYVSYGACGMPFLISGVISDHSELIQRTPEEFRRQGIVVKLRHKVISVLPKDNKIIIESIENGEIYEETYDKLLIATGATPIIPPLQGLSLKNIFTLKSLDDALLIKAAAEKEEIRKVLIVGGGYIGIEIAESMKALGKEVTIVEAASKVMGTFDKEISDIIEKELKEQGIELHLEERVKEFRGEDYISAVETSKGYYKADLVILAVGVMPNTKLLEGCGIKLGEKQAVIVDEYLRTSVENIYAAGDCALNYHKVLGKHTYIPLATSANKMGKIAGENMAGGSRAFTGILGSSMTKVFRYEVAATGITETEAKLEKINYGTNFIKGKSNSGYYPGAEDIYIKLIYNKDTNVILGGQIMGKNGAALRAGVLSAAIEKSMTIQEMALLDLGYTPPYGTTWDILNIAAETAR